MTEPQAGGGAAEGSTKAAKPKEGGGSSGGASAAAAAAAAPPALSVASSTTSSTKQSSPKPKEKKQPTAEKATQDKQAKEGKQGAPPVSDQEKALARVDALLAALAATPPGPGEVDPVTLLALTNAQHYMRRNEVLRSAVASAQAVMEAGTDDAASRAMGLETLACMLQEMDSNVQEVVRLYKSIAQRVGGGGGGGGGGDGGL